MSSQEKRRSERITYPYTVKFRVPGQEAWNAVTPINMSESGICFLSTEEYPIGMELQFYISNPLREEQLGYQAKVVRCDASKARSMFFTVAVHFEDMPEFVRLVYTKMLKSLQERNKS